MFVAKELRKNSIAEYLLYMWQMEDLIRVYGCSLPVIKREYINKFDFTEEQKEEELDWIGNLIRMMNEEGKREYGHLQINEVLLKDVCDLHHRLLQSSKFPFYNAAYYKALPFIVELRNKGDKDINEIETCLDALYGIMMLRLQKKAMFLTCGRLRSHSAASPVDAEQPLKNQSHGKLLSAVTQRARLSVLRTTVVPTI